MLPQEKLPEVKPVPVDDQVLDAERNKIAQAIAHARNGSGMVSAGALAGVITGSMAVIAARHDQLQREAMAAAAAEAAAPVQAATVETAKTDGETPAPKPN